ncbi:MAG: HlyD family efflux transporter periplasmic adaptor subunit [Planctomycetota bacterium]
MATTKKLLLRHAGAVAFTLGLSGAFVALSGVAAAPLAVGVKAPSPTPVAVAPPRAADSYAVTRRYTGTVAARRVAPLGFERGGRLIAVLAREGDRVTAGQPMARLDDRLLAARRTVWMARIARAESERRELLAGPRTQVVDQARARCAIREAELRECERHLTRTAELVERAAAPQAEQDGATDRRDAARARLELARHTLAELEAGTRREELAAQDAVVRELESELSQLDVEIAQGVLTAPYDGVVAARHQDEGTVIDAGQPVFRLIESGVPQARVGVPPAAAAKLRQDAQHTVIVRGRKHSAAVVATLPELDPETRTRTVVLALPAAAGVAPGEVVFLPTREVIRERGHWLPTHALLRSGRGLWACLVAEPIADDAVPHYVVARREVEVLHTTGDRCFVRGTLGDQELVVSGGVERVVAGQRVQPLVQSPAETPAESPAELPVQPAMRR